MATHTVLVAQSGSGKSALLGRIVEELLIQTHARCLILDPNSDFRRVHELKPARLWDRASYDPVARRGLLPHEATQEEFRQQWARVPVRVWGGDGFGEEDATARRVRLWWPALAVDFLAEDLDPVERSELYHCHAFLRAIADLARFQEKGEGENFSALETAETLYLEAAAASSSPRAAQQRLEVGLRKAFPLDELTEEAVGRLYKGLRDALPIPWLLRPLPRAPEKVQEAVVRSRIRARFERAMTALNYVSPEIIRFYFGKAREYQAAGILASEPPEESASRARLEVIDLASLAARDTRLLVLNATLSTVWDRARSEWALALQGDAEEDSRVPTFIILEEAHNLVPAEPRSKPEAALREQFRQIVAEGRKYGLFLILVSQRPDKLDPLVLSECENKAVMRLDSWAVRDLAVEALGLQSVPEDLLARTVEFGIGRALLAGRWVRDKPRVLYAAARRTIEGGRSLRAKHWAGSSASGAKG
ncbi:MAG: ATP-binding protein [Thermoplasmata archaeon]